MISAVRSIQKETELLDFVREHLEQKRLDVYHEVAPPGIEGEKASRRRCDLVVFDSATDTLGVIEGKLAFGMDVIEQAGEWRDSADLVYVAVRSVAECDRPRGYRRMRQSCVDDGIGIMEVFPSGEIRRVLEPRRVRPDPRRRAAMISVLSESNRAKPGMAGAAGGRAASKREGEIAMAYQAISLFMAEAKESPTKSVRKKLMEHHPVLGRSKDKWLETVRKAAQDLQILNVRERDQWGMSVLYYQKETT